jgi:hypothetical protein
MATDVKEQLNARNRLSNFWTPTSLVTKEIAESRTDTSGQSEKRDDSYAFLNRAGFLRQVLALV